MFDQLTVINHHNYTNDIVDYQLIKFIRLAIVIQKLLIGMIN